MKDSVYKKILPQLKMLSKNLENFKNIKSIKKWEDIPFMNTEDLLKMNSVNIKNKKGICVYFTSGTTSKPKAVYYNDGDIKNTANYIKWICKIENIKKGKLVVILMDQSFWGVGYFTMLGHVRYGNRVIPVDTDLPPSKIREILEITKPDIISSIPSILLDLEKYLKGISFNLIETTGEILSDKNRKKIESIYGGEVYDAYGLVEGVVGVECQYHNGYHYNPNKLKLEIVDISGNKLCNDKWGELVMTILDNKTTPLIRYKTGDFCKINFVDCLCGRKYPRVWIKNRIEKVYYLYEGYRLEHKLIQKLINKEYKKLKNIEVKSEKKAGIFTISIFIENSDIEINEEIRKKLEKISFEIIHMVRNKKIIIYVS